MADRRPPEFHEGLPAANRFNDAMRRIVTVTKDELARREDEDREDRQQKKSAQKKSGEIHP